MSASTSEIDRQGSGGAGWILALLVIGLLWVVLMGAVGAGMEGLAVSPHAEAKHGPSVQSAASYLDSGGPVNKDDCFDETGKKTGKQMWTWTMNGEQWCAIVKGRTIVTMFPTNQDYIESVKKRDGCGPGLQLGSHDAPSMAW